MTTWYATSRDGLGWKSTTEVLRGTPGSWDARGTRVTAVSRRDPLTVLYDGRSSAAANWFETTGLARHEDGRLRTVGDGPVAVSPYADGALRYVTAVDLRRRPARFYFEAARADGAHDLRTSSADRTGGQPPATGPDPPAAGRDPAEAIARAANDPRPVVARQSAKSCPVTCSSGRCRPAAEQDRAALLGVELRPDLGLADVQSRDQRSATHVATPAGGRRRRRRRRPGSPGPVGAAGRPARTAGCCPAAWCSTVPRRCRGTGRPG